MKAIHFEHPGDADVLKLIDLPRPLVKEDNQILIKNKYAGVNRPDLIKESEITLLLKDIQKSWT